MPTDGPAVTRPLRLVAWVVLAAALAGAGLLAVLRLGDPTSRRLVEAVTLAPLGLPLAALGVVVAVVLLARGGRGARAARSAAALAAALALALTLTVAHAWWLAPLYAGARPAGSTPSFVVMTQNLEYGDVGALARTAVAHDVDVLVLLEVTPDRLAEVLATDLGARLPHTASHDARQGMGTIVLSRLPVARAASLYEGAESLVVDLVDDRFGPVTVVAVHTRPPYDAQGWRDDHAQVHAGLVGLRADTDAALVVAGDLNATLAHAPLRRLVDLGLRDAAVQANGGWSPTWPVGGHQRRFGITVPAFAAIDHVLTSPGLVVTQASTTEVDGADHRAVVATVSRADR